MGLDDEQEKLRQARAWLCDPAATGEQCEAAFDHVTTVAASTQREDLREQALSLLREAGTV